MGAIRARARSPIGQAVLEALDALLTTELRDGVLALALRIHGGDDVPEEAERARDFVEGPLRTAVQRLVGEEAAHFVLDRLSPMLVMAGSQVRRTEDREAEAIPTAPPPASTELLVATLDRNAVRLLGALLGPAVSARRVPDIFELVSRLDAGPNMRAVIVLDCRSAPIDPSTLLRIRRLAAGRCTLVVWNASEELRRRLTHGQPETEGLILTDADLSMAELAHLVRPFF
jgi:hypothetical protein